MRSSSSAGTAVTGVELLTAPSTQAKIGSRGTSGRDRKFTEPRRPDAVLRGKLPVWKFIRYGTGTLETQLSAGRRCVGVAFDPLRPLDNRSMTGTTTAATSPRSDLPLLEAPAAP
jgi:hypothetical protein